MPADAAARFKLAREAPGVVPVDGDDEVVAVPPGLVPAGRHHIGEGEELAGVDRPEHDLAADLGGEALDVARRTTSRPCVDDQQPVAHLLQLG